MPTLHPSGSLSHLRSELLALDRQLRNPPRPMLPDLRKRLEVAYNKTLHEIDHRLRCGVQQ